MSPFLSRLSRPPHPGPCLSRLGLGALREGHRVLCGLRTRSLELFLSKGRKMNISAIAVQGDAQPRETGGTAGWGLLTPLGAAPHSSLCQALLRPVSVTPPGPARGAAAVRAEGRRDSFQ